MFVPLHLLAAVLVLHLASQLPGGDAAFSGSMRCPCASSLGASWELSLDQAVRVSDVVMMGRVLELRDGLGGMMNASLSSMITYKGRFSQGGGFLTRVDHVTNFEKGAPREMALFFFATEPAGNLALQCMAPLTALNSVGDLKAVLDFVRDFGRRKFAIIFFDFAHVCIEPVMWCGLLDHNPALVYSAQVYVPFGGGGAVWKKFFWCACSRVWAGI